MCRMMCWPHVALPHAGVAALGVVLFVLYLCGVLRV